jgi:two-component system response regulator VanR
LLYLIDKYKKNGENRMNEKILVVDDEHDIADLLEVYLQNENYIVYKFNSAKEALTCIEQEELDLAILDIMLPDISGFSLCQKIRENTHTPLSC